MHVKEKFFRGGQRFGLVDRGFEVELSALLLFPDEIVEFFVQFQTFAEFYGQSFDFLRRETVLGPLDRDRGREFPKNPFLLFRAQRGGELGIHPRAVPRLGMASIGLKTKQAGRIGREFRVARRPADRLFRRFGGSGDLPGR